MRNMWYLILAGNLFVYIFFSGMLISMPFLLVTFIVYAILPESNLHRKALMFYVLSLLFAYIFLVTVQLHDGKFSDGICHTLGYLVIFFFLASFFWMNVMCIDMWLAFSGSIHMPSGSYIESSTVDGIPNLLYFYGPMAVITLINIVLFILTAVKIQKVKKETSMLKHSDSKRHSYEADKQNFARRLTKKTDTLRRFNLYLKLLFAMGINWSMEIISWAIIWKMGTSVPHYIWYLTDFCNAMYGVFIFFIFVFKKKIWRSLKKR
ncbi:hypothetical protein NQ318_022635 [Aromia moschata]|uniref:Uncharacterized protein n=1 Tax=Aromia moschata TaxID=1265417 RepID=A0AAV8YKX4_9CUCU|nr:hypothetical protein NQ318_022635 [Aromia moschata]